MMGESPLSRLGGHHHHDDDGRMLLRVKGGVCGEEGEEVGGTRPTSTRWVC